MFALLFGASALGMWVKSLLPDHHLGAETKDSVRVGMGSVATMAALVLGLLVAATKSKYDAEKGEVIEMSAKIIYLDQLLENYGPEAAECRTLLRGATQSTIDRLWPDSSITKGTLPPGTAWSREMPVAIQSLSPQSDAQRAFKEQAADLVEELGQLRWLLYEQSESSISTPMLAIMVLWLALTFVSVGLFAPFNGTAVLAQLLAALSVAGAIFLILELDHSFGGILRIPSEPMVSALHHVAD